MGKASRWSQWVIAESADPRIQLPWTAGERVRKSTRRGKKILTLALPRVEVSAQPLH